jgi:hypothetical protein
MQANGELKQLLERSLCTQDSRDPAQSRFVREARRFCARVTALVERGKAPRETDLENHEIACLPLQLPHRRQGQPGKITRSSLRDRAEQAAEMLVSLTGNHRGAPNPALDPTIQLLQQVYQRHPAGDLAMLLADTLNLEDFGVSGLVALAVATGRQDGTVVQVAEGCVKREQYGYWDARLKDGFHHEPIRQLARKRLEQARKVATLLLAELNEDGAL